MLLAASLMLGLSAFNQELITPRIARYLNNDRADTNAVMAGTALAFAGNIDEISIWNRGLSRQELDALFQNGNGCKLR